MKKTVWILCALLGALLLTSCGGARREETRFSGGEDTPYPYAWTECADGSVAFELPEAESGRVWRGASSDDGVVSLDVLTAAPRAEGSSVVTFTLTGEADETERLCELRFLLDVEGDKPAATVRSHSAALLQGVLHGGEELGCPYRLWKDADGEQRLVIGDTELSSWSIYLPVAGVIDCRGLAASEGGVAAQLYGVAPGEAAISFRNAEKGLCLDLRCASDGYGDVTVLEHAMRAYDAEQEGPDGYAEAKALVPALPLLKEAEIYRTAALGGEEADTAIVTVRYLPDADGSAEVAYTCYLSESLTERELAVGALLRARVSAEDDAAANEAALDEALASAKKRAVGDTELTVLTTKDGAYALWTKDGCAYLLSRKGVSSEQENDAIRAVSDAAARLLG